MEITPELLTAFAGVIGAAGVLVKQIRDGRKERRARRKSDKALKKIGNAAARTSSSVADAVDELERTGSFQFSIPDDDDGKP